MKSSGWICCASVIKRFVSKLLILVRTPSLSATKHTAAVPFTPYYMTTGTRRLRSLPAPTLHTHPLAFPQSLLPISEKPSDDAGQWSKRIILSTFLYEKKSRVFIRKRWSSTRSTISGSRQARGEGKHVDAMFFFLLCRCISMAYVVIRGYSIAKENELSSILAYSAQNNKVRGRCYFYFIVLLCLFWFIGGLRSSHSCLICMIRCRLSPRTSENRERKIELRLEIEKRTGDGEARLYVREYRPAC
ncbi:hypothetical protein F5B17DRAFT_27011 [Nemania serpens]|nr:hypothetical protein F5B17DRAFT_27011 [Nemania serpens]